MRKKGAKGAPLQHLTLKEQNKQREKIMTKLCPRGKAAAKKKI